MRSRKSEEVKKQVFCKSCRFYRVPADCSFGDNVTKEVTPIKVEIRYGDCMAINKDNTCPNYRQA
jgi:hypothetical protein